MISTMASHEYASLLALAGEITREADLDGLLLKILTKSLPWMRVEACSVFLADEETGDLVMHSAHGGGAPQLGQLRVPAGLGIVGTAMREKHVIRVDDAAHDPRVFKEADKKSGWTTKALLAAPLLDGEKCLGVVEFLNPVGRTTFTEEDEQLTEYFAGLVAAAVGRVRSHAAALERAALQRDLDLARDLQKGLLPLKFPSADASPQIDLFATLQPAEEVSGDLYDFFFIEPDKLCFVVGDVSGKGVAAGIFMAMTRTLLRALARPEHTPAEILSRLNAELCRDNDACLFVTMVLGIVNVHSGEIVCGLGAHNPPVHVRCHGVAEFGPVGGSPLGLMPGARFDEWRLHLAPGESLFVYTDGVTEALDESRQLFTNQRLLATLSTADASTSEILARCVANKIASFVGDADRSDDITLMVLRRRA